MAMKTLILIPILFLVMNPSYSVDVAKQMKVRENPKVKVVRQITIARKVYLR
jgi:hypothetical protein